MIEVDILSVAVRLHSMQHRDKDWSKIVYEDHSWDRDFRNDSFIYDGFSMNFSPAGSLDNFRLKRSFKMFTRFQIEKEFFLSRLLEDENLLSKKDHADATCIALTVQKTREYFPRRNILSTSIDTFTVDLLKSAKWTQISVMAIQNMALVWKNLFTKIFLLLKMMAI